jgi:CubicO group peptidase (beta-lactamase class C family)
VGDALTGLGLPGVVWLVSRRGVVEAGAVGAYERDTVLRISSLTKPIVAAAALTLVEEGRLSLDEPVDGLLPELAGRRVLRTPGGSLNDTVPAVRPITLRDLLTLRMGFGSVFDGSPLAEAAGPLNSFGPPTEPPDVPPDEWMARLGALPLMFQPGTRWLYATGSHVLGVLVARAAGQPLGDVLRSRVFDPLGMRDTGFVSSDLPPCYGDDGAVIDGGGADSRWSRPPVFPDAAGGLVSTVDDCLAFARLLLAGGRPGVLSAASVAAMTTNQVSDAEIAGSFFLEDGRGWGFGLSVAPPASSSAWYGWDGGLGGSWRNDPAEDLIGIVLTQRLTTPDSPPLAEEFWKAVHA